MDSLKKYLLKDQQTYESGSVNEDYLNIFSNWILDFLKIFFWKTLKAAKMYSLKYFLKDPQGYKRGSIKKFC